ncbi:hypothetical protein LPJ53_003720 [Coemansia erecta]|uniref:Uncharacterized protein n=1 Tax=Coemansia erecta TaxID=147472 RepID=A0A9W7XZJ1_9FUNG|nr:hypothetical protein LPJ53_003720 [Coemansia erecta]
MTIREATHAGSWYTDNPTELDRELQRWLNSVPGTVAEIEPSGQQTTVPVPGAVRAIIGPHAGYSYSGSNAAFAYKCIDTTAIRRVFLLGPSHHVYLSNKCALSKCTKYATPLGNIRVNLEIVDRLRGSGRWHTMRKDVDEEEHSLEMHLPYIYKTFERKINQISLVPIMVGGLNFEAEQYYGEILAPYLADPENLFVISSDFCHWGSRFRYTYYREQGPADSVARPVNLKAHGSRPAGTPIWESIERLDRDGMETVAQMDHEGFRRYLDATQNTICGRHPIGVLLAAVNKLYPAAEGPEDGENPRLRFVKYDQSSKVLTVTPTSPSAERPASSATARIDGLTSAEREEMVNEAEWGFRTWLRESGPQMGYVLYPSTRQILKSLQTLYTTLDGVDFSDIAL